MISGIFFFIRMVLFSFFVVVIDFGIMFFGYVFFFFNDYEKDFLRILVVNWFVGSGCLVFLKILICVLFDFKGEFYLFGFEVEDKYFDLVFEN